VSNLSLYLATILIWGSTWFAIKLQLGVVPPAISVCWRFLAAAVILLGYARLRGLPLRFSRRDHLWMALQGLMLFCLNYVGFYLAEQTLASGLVAVICSMMLIGNIAGMRLFLPELRAVVAEGKVPAGIALAVGATVSASLGNTDATRNHRAGYAMVAIPVVAVLGRRAAP
jgi:hypothetical protein